MLGRRQGAAVIGLLVTAALVLAWTTSALLPAPLPVTDEDDRRTATCEDPATGEAPHLVRSAALFACPERFDGQRVVVEGEAVGDLLRGPRGATWVQVNDDAYARVGPLGAHDATLGTNAGVAVLLPAGGVRPSALGGPGVHGDLLRVEGVFQVAAAVDQGGPAVVATDVEVVAAGGPVAERRTPGLGWVATASVLVTGALGVAVLRRRRRLAA